MTEVYGRQVAVFVQNMSSIWAQSLNEDFKIMFHLLVVCMNEHVLMSQSI